MPFFCPFIGWSLIDQCLLEYPFPVFYQNLSSDIMQAACSNKNPLQERLCWLFDQRVIPVLANFERRKAITCKHFTLCSVFQIFTLNPVGIPAVYVLTSVASWTLRWFSVLGCRCAGGSRNPRSLYQQLPSIQSTGIIILLINIVSLSPRDRPLASKCAKALQRATARLSSRTDLIQINLLFFACACAARAAATARRMCSDRALARKRTVTCRNLSMQIRMCMYLEQKYWQKYIPIHTACIWMYLYVFVSKLQLVYQV